MSLDIKKIRTASYNPRTMSRETRKALSKSMEEFEDISGIVLNRRTGNIVSGNHRWEALNEKYGKENLSIVLIADNIYSINILDADERFNHKSGFIMKVVDWDIKKEKAANVAANSDLLQGEFTSGLQDILNDISSSMDESLFEDLRFDDLSIDLSSLDDNLSLDDDEAMIKKDNSRKDSERKNKDLIDAQGEEVPECKIILTQVKISVPGELEPEFREDLKNMISKKYYRDDIKVL